MDRPSPAHKTFVVFSKASGSDRSLGAAELAGWLEGAAKECCCKIRVVLFSCHSGSFVDDLMAQAHVDSVWTSSAADEKSYSEAAYALDGSFRSVSQVTVARPHRRVHVQFFPAGLREGAPPFVSEVSALMQDASCSG